MSKKLECVDNNVHNASSTPPNIEQRLEFMELDSDRQASIRSLKSLVERELPHGLDKFYAQLRKTPEVKKFFSSDEHIRRAKNAQVGHWVNISDGNFNQDYCQKVQTIGAVHARIGLEPRWYIGGYAIILDHLIKTAIAECFPKPGLFAKKSMKSADFGTALSSLIKATLLDMDLAISVYIHEAEIAKQKAQAEAIATEQQRVTDSFGKAIAALAAKELDYRIIDELPAAYGPLRDDFNNALMQLSETIENIGDAATHINAGTREISSAADDLARRTEQQAASVEQTAAAIEQITTTVKDTSQRADQAGQLVAKAKIAAEKSGDVVKQAVAAMDAINVSSNQISNIIGVIDDIAFQTNLLALNAGVEAARAGDAGKGFAVVAQEVRELAQRSANAAKEIKTLIMTSGEQVKAGVTLVGETGQTLEVIADEVSEINTHVSSIAEATREQATALQEVNAAVNIMDQGTQQNAAMVEETNAASHSLVKEVERIADMLKEFGTRGGSGNTSSRMPSSLPRSQTKSALPTPDKSPRALSIHGNNALARESWEEF